MKALFIALLLMATPAFAYGDHSGWSAYRGGYNSSYQFTTSMEALQSTMTVSDSSTQDPVVTQYRGMGFKTAIGVELARFVRFDAYNIYEDESASLSNSLRGDEIGGDVKASFYGPVVNINFGLGLFGSSLVNQTPESSLRYYGQGYVGTIGIERFVSQMSSVEFQVKGSSQQLHPEDTSVKIRPEVNTIGVSLGLILWLSNTY